MDAGRLGYRSADCEPWIEGRVRVLEDHLYSLPEFSQGGALKLVDIPRPDRDYAAVHGEQPHEAVGERTLAAAALPNDPENLAWLEADTDAVERGEPRVWRSTHNLA